MIDAIILAGYLVALPVFVFTYLHGKRQTAQDRKSLENAAQDLRASARDFHDVVEKLSEKLGRNPSKNQPQDEMILAVAATGRNPYELVSHGAIGGFGTVFRGGALDVILVGDPPKEDWSQFLDWQSYSVRRQEQWPSQLEGRDVWLEVAEARPTLSVRASTSHFRLSPTTLLRWIKFRAGLSSLLSRISPES